MVESGDEVSDHDSGTWGELDCVIDPLVPEDSFVRESSSLSGLNVGLNVGWRSRWRMCVGIDERLGSVVHRDFVISRSKVDVAVGRLEDGYQGLLVGERCDVFVWSFCGHRLGGP